MVPKRGRKQVQLNFEVEYLQHVERIRTLIGGPVPLSRAYTHGEQPILIAIEGDTATIRFRNGAQLTNVPLRDLVNDAGYWK